MPEPFASPSLSNRISTATHNTHKTLNTLITSFLPLALPPATKDPALYANAMKGFVLIYGAFEDSLRELGDENRENERDGRGRIKKREKDERIRKLYTNDLERAPRLRRDIENIILSSSASSSSSCSSSTTSRAPSRNMEFPPPDFESELQFPHLHSFIQHIRPTTRQEPHLLLAYTWVLYMALFSGGRLYIRARLREAGVSGFWDVHGNHNNNNSRRRMEEDEDDEEDGMISVDEKYLTFWTFPHSNSTPNPNGNGDDDGASLKATFVSAFTSAESILTPTEKDQVVHEAVLIMHSMIAVVQELGTVSASPCKSAAAAAALLPCSSRQGGWRSWVNGNGNGRGRGGKGREEEEDIDDEAGISFLLLLLKHVLPMGMFELMAAALVALAGSISVVRVGTATTGPSSSPSWSARAG